MQTGSASNIARYGNCMEGTWEPSRERHGWVMKEATIFSWEDVPRRTRAGVVHANEVWVFGVINGGGSPDSSCSKTTLVGVHGSTDGGIG
jgi:hypothetical protein